jgi:hypothetical protein
MAELSSASTVILLAATLVSLRWTMGGVMVYSGWPDRPIATLS